MEDRRSNNPGRFQLTEEQIARVRKLYREGLTITDIAKRFGVGPTTVSKHVKKDIRQ